VRRRRNDIHPGRSMEFMCRSRPQAPPSRAQGRGRGHDGNPILKKRTTTVGARTKRASTAAEVGDRYDGNMDYLSMC
jgi:hypothetical protein